MVNLFSSMMSLTEFIDEMTLAKYANLLKFDNARFGVDSAV